MDGCLYGCKLWMAMNFFEDIQSKGITKSVYFQVMFLFLTFYFEVYYYCTVYYRTSHLYCLLLSQL